MAHTKATGVAKRNVNVAGKRLGVKRFAGEFVHAGNIIIRQKGTKFHPGKNTMLGKDYTVFATADGFVSFRQMTGYKRTQKRVDVIPADLAPALEVKKQEKPTAPRKSTVSSEAKPKAAAKPTADKPATTKATSRTKKQ